MDGESSMVGKASKEKQLSDYRLVLWQKNAGFYLELPEINIRVHDHDLQKAYEKLEESYVAALAEYRDAGADFPTDRASVDSATSHKKHVSSADIKSNQQPDLIGQLIAFTAKTAIIMVVAGAVLVFGVNFAFNTMIKPSISNIISGGIANETYITLQTLAEKLKNASPEKREALSRDLRTIGKELSPFIEESMRSLRKTSQE